MLPLRYIFLAMSMWSVASGALQKVLLIMRHGDRTTGKPLFPTELKSDINNGMGEITELGRMEGYELGIRLRTMYQTFLTNNTKEVRVNSSAFSGCLITTGCALTGMYTPDNNETCMNGTGNDGWPVTVNSIPKAEDFVLDSSACGQFKVEQLSKDTVEANNDFLQRHNVTVNKVANYTGYQKITSGDLYFHVYDNLLIEKIHNLTSQYGWVDPMWPDIQSAAYPAYYLPFTTNASRKLTGGPILNEIVESIKDGDNTTKLHVYGTGRAIISPLLLLLGVDNELPPPYTATLVVELHDNATVRFLYINSTDAPISLKIPHCDVYCSVDRFVKLTRPFIVRDPVQECRVNKGDK